MNAALFTTTSLLPAAQIVQTTTGGAVNVRDLKGKGKIVLAASAAAAGTDPTLTVKLTHCATSGGTYTDVAGGAFAVVTDAASVQTIGLDLDSLHEFVKVVATLGGTDTPTFSLAVTAESLTD